MNTELSVKMCTIPLSGFWGIFEANYYNYLQVIIGKFTSPYSI